MCYKDFYKKISKKFQRFYTEHSRESEEAAGEISRRVKHNQEEPWKIEVKSEFQNNILSTTKREPNLSIAAPHQESPPTRRCRSNHHHHSHRHRSLLIRRRRREAAEAAVAGTATVSQSTGGKENQRQHEANSKTE
ncbi:hypothetical protein LXL04_003557 [Taraxacum kok-saghyz]